MTTNSSNEITQLATVILQSDCLDLASKKALRSFSQMVSLHIHSTDHKAYMFQICTPTNNKPPDNDLPNEYFLTLQVIKGSLRTLLWNTFARLDDEYALFFHPKVADFGENFDQVLLVWSVKGIDAFNSKVSLGLTDWFLIRKIQYSMRVLNIGALAFTKILGRLLLSLPNFLDARKYLPPMPATFMFNYLMVVSHCPFELRVAHLDEFLSRRPTALYPIANKMLLQQFMQRTGSGSWVNGYIIMQLQQHRFYLCSKHYVDSICKQSDHLGTAPLNSVEFENSIAPSAVSFSSPVGTKINEILRDTAIRVVELREHPLGANGLVLVLECIHNQNWAANQRFVGLDVYQFYAAIQSNERIPLSKQSAMIPLLSQNEWERLLEGHHAATNRTHFYVQEAMFRQSSIDFSNSSKWGALCDMVRPSNFYDIVLREMKSMSMPSHFEATEE